MSKVLDFFALVEVPGPVTATTYIHCVTSSQALQRCTVRRDTKLSEPSTYCNPLSFPQYFGLSTCVNEEKLKRQELALRRKLTKLKTGWFTYCNSLLDYPIYCLPQNCLLVGNPEVGNSEHITYQDCLP